MKGVLALFLPLAYRLQSPPANGKQGLLTEDPLTLRNKGKNYTLFTLSSQPSFTFIRRNTFFPMEIGGAP